MKVFCSKRVRISIKRKMTRSLLVWWMIWGFKIGYSTKNNIFTEGKFEDWLRDRLQKFQSYMQDSRLDSVEIRFFVEEDGSVSLINILNMPDVYQQEDEAFRAKVTAVISGSEWTPATVSDGKPVSSIVTVSLRDLR